MKKLNERINIFAIKKFKEFRNESKTYGELYKKIQKFSYGDYWDNENSFIDKGLYTLITSKMIKLLENEVKEKTID